jgi:hypothetical protein
MSRRGYSKGSVQDKQPKRGLGNAVCRYAVGTQF